MVDQWEKYIDLMADSIYINSGRGCINCSGIWASRHTKEIAEAIAEKIGPIEATAAGTTRQPAWPRSPCPARPKAVWRHDRSRPEGVRRHRHDRQVRPAAGREGTLRLPAADDRALRRRPTAAIAKKEYMFPFATVVEVPAGQDAGRRSARRWSARRSPKNAKLIQRADRRDAHRPAEHRPDPDDQAQLAAAARREHRRLPVPQPGVSGGEVAINAAIRGVFTTGVSVVTLLARGRKG